jgi:microcystin-dependent protein
MTAVTVNSGHFSVVLGNITPIEPSIFKGDTYLGMKVGSANEMVPRQKLTSVPYAMTAGSGGIPKGGIIMWSGSIATIPEGWALCDGQDKTASDGIIVKTPDLRDRFIVGARQDSGTSARTNISGSLTQVGGNDVLSGNTGNHILTTAEMPIHTHIQTAHTHDITDPTHRHSTGGEGGTNASTSYYANANQNVRTSYVNYAATGITINNATATNQNTGGGGAHNHPLNDISIINPYYALAFIIKL